MSSPTQPIKYATPEHRALAWDEPALRAILFLAQSLQQEIKLAREAVGSSTAHDALGGLHDAISNGLPDLKAAIEGEVS